MRASMLSQNHLMDNPETIESLYNCESFFVELFCTIILFFLLIDSYMNKSCAAGAKTNRFNDKKTFHSKNRRETLKSPKERR